MSEPNRPGPPSWRKASFSISGECVEVAIIQGAIAIRDSKDKDGPSLTFSLGAWREFLTDYEHT